MFEQKIQNTLKGLNIGIFEQMEPEAFWTKCDKL